MRWLTLGLGAALGYFLASSEGRQNLDKMSQNAQKLWNDPKTQEKVGQVQESAQQKFAEVKNSDKVQDLAAKVGVGEKAAASSTSSSTTHGTTGAMREDETTASNNENVQAANATGADPDIISDPSTPLGDEGPMTR